MDLSSIIGIVGCFGIVFYGIITGTDGFKSIENFWDLNSIYITVGGSFLVVLGSFSFKEFLNGLKSMGIVLKSSKSDSTASIRHIIELSNTARREGLLALEEAANELDDPFLKKGVLLIVDGTDEELVRNILETDIMYLEERHGKVIAFWEQLAVMGPAWGMIGTLIGLINMLKHMTDTESVGPNMSTALITTLYGSMLANWLCAPVISKLSGKSAAEVLEKDMILEGLLAIQAGQNPRVIEEKLKSYLSPQQRASISEDAGGEVDG